MIELSTRIAMTFDNHLHEPNEIKWSMRKSFGQKKRKNHVNSSSILMTIIITDIELSVFLKSCILLFQWAHYQGSIFLIFTFWSFKCFSVNSKNKIMVIIVIMIFSESAGCTIEIFIITKVVIWSQKYQCWQFCLFNNTRNLYNSCLFVILWTDRFRDDDI